MTSEPLRKTANSARVNGYLYLGIGFLLLMATVTFAVRNPHERETLMTLGILSATNLSGSVCILYVANRLDAGKLWAGIAMVVLSVFVLGDTVVSMLMVYAFAEAPVVLKLGVVGRIVGFYPSMYLGMACLNMLPELRHMYHAQLRERRQLERGFDVIQDAGQAGIKSGRLPPRPTTVSHRTAKRDAE